jgi:hypothetical protein
MRQDLKHRLIQWKNDLHPGEIKKVFISDSPLKQGEYLIRLEKSMSGKLSPIIVSNKFLTDSQQEAMDITSDIDHLNKVIGSLEKEFNDRYEQVVHETFSDKLIRYAQLN